MSPSDLGDLLLDTAAANDSETARRELTWLDLFSDEHEEPLTTCDGLPALPAMRPLNEPEFELDLAG